MPLSWPRLPEPSETDGGGVGRVELIGRSGGVGVRKDPFSNFGVNGECYKVGVGTVLVSVSGSDSTEGKSRSGTGSGTWWNQYVLEDQEVIHLVSLPQRTISRHTRSGSKPRKTRSPQPSPHRYNSQVSYPKYSLSTPRSDIETGSSKTLELIR